MSSTFQSDVASVVFEQDFGKCYDLDDRFWQFDDGPVHNNEIQVYTRKINRNAWIENGTLVIEARKEGDVVTSARLVTCESWKYGRFEVVAKVPAGVGTWPAAWLLNDRHRYNQCAWPLCGEIDIMEHVGFDPGVFHFTMHTAENNHVLNTQLSRKVCLLESDPRFHTFALDWTADKLEFFLDGDEVYQVIRTGDNAESWPFDDKFYLILNLAIGGDWGGQKGVDDAIFPARYEIKSVRVYQ
jgi:beta-glucanase (GH16 family)